MQSPLMKSLSYFFPLNWPFNSDYITIFIKIFQQSPTYFYKNDLSKKIIKM